MGFYNVNALTGDTTTVHGFEDRDLSDYDTYNTAGEGTVPSPSLNESYSLEIEAQSGGYSTLYSSTGLDTYPSQGDKWAIKLRYNSNARDDGVIGFGFGGQSSEKEPDGYVVGLSFANRLTFTGPYISKDARGTILSSASVTLDDEDVYRFEIDWATDDTITALLYNETDNTQETTISATDSTYSSGGLFWTVGNNQSLFYYDNGSVSQL